MAKKAMLGHKVRRLRRDGGLTQAAMADRLGISASYLNLIEANQRPVTVDLLLKIAQAFDIDLASFAEDEGAKRLGGLREVFSDPLLAGVDMRRADMIELAERVPAAADALATLYRAYRDMADRGALGVQAGPGATDGGVAAGAGFALDEVGAFFHDQGNYFPALEEVGDEVWTVGGFDPNNLWSGLIDYLDRKLTLRVKVMPVDVMGVARRRYDRHGRRILLSEMLPMESRVFELAVQIALIKYRGLLDRLVGAAHFSSEAAPGLARLGLANYLAAAVVMPYERFWRAATSVRYDIDILCQRFQASVEQVCHRLTTLQRPGAKGVPFFMVRVDKAGNVSKRFSAVAAPFARHGGACPRWNLHDAFRSPGRTHVQVSAMPEGERYFSIARAVFKPGAGHRQPGQTYAIGLGCEIDQAGQIVYADGVDVLNEEAAVPVGLHCRICERLDCTQRAFPPSNHALVVDDNQRGVMPYGFSAANPPVA